MKNSNQDPTEAREKVVESPERNPVMADELLLEILHDYLRLVGNDPDRKERIELVNKILERGCKS